MKDYRLEITVKNGLLWTAMKDFGHDTVADLSRACGVNQSIIGKFMNLKKPVMGHDLAVLPTAQKLCDYFGMGIEELFPQEVVMQGIPTNKIERWANSEELLGISQVDEDMLLPDRKADRHNAKAIVKNVLETLTPREAKVVRMRFGIDESSDYTLEEAAELCNITSEGVRQIEAKALRKLRSLKHDRGKKTREALDAIA